MPVLPHTHCHVNPHAHPPIHPLLLHLNTNFPSHDDPRKPARTTKQAPIKRRCLPLLFTPIFSTKPTIPPIHQRLQLNWRHVLHDLTQQRIMSLHHDTRQRRLTLCEPRSLERCGGRNVDASLIETGWGKASVAAGSHFDDLQVRSRYHDWEWAALAAMRS